MPRSKESQAISKLNDAWDLLCPKVDQGFVWRLYSEMKGETDREVCRAAVGRLWDGLTYGNWPSAGRNP